MALEVAHVQSALIFPRSETNLNCDFLSIHFRQPQAHNGGKYSEQNNQKSVPIDW
ncbi:hypothetical protein [Methylomicrobium sp. Wu6]|uniref:hypothetical protein n=1 Tax=Methylomicrobium sp. Wu6 TaxID=3107928 RepID=UPI002DD62072|nr:hypothetical protein [Methylomicrobium sp. Wu6]MEC4747351.1 hypothetical protein [Methylomicrobium sp. Wu6]